MSDLPRRIATVLLTALALTGCALAPSQSHLAAASGRPAGGGSGGPGIPGAVPQVAGVTVWKTNAAPMAWRHGRIYYNSANAAGVFDGYAARADGSGAACLTCTLFPAGTQHGISDVTPDGRYALTTVERAVHPPLSDGLGIAAPGQGAYNDLWLQTTDGARAWRLVDLLAQHTNALIWARFDTTGTRLIWSEQWRWGVPFGGWEMHTASIAWTAGTPRLRNVTTLRSTGLLEAYGFSPDGGHVLFAGDAIADTPWDDLQIMTMPADLHGSATRLSPHASSDTGTFTNYNEFAYYMPGSQRILFARSAGAFYGSLEYWTMSRTGTDAEQLTRFSTPGTVQYLGFPSILGGLAFDPADPARFVVARQINGHYEALMVTLTGA